MSEIISKSSQLTRRKKVDHPAPTAKDLAHLRYGVAGPIQILENRTPPRNAQVFLETIKPPHRVHWKGYWREHGRVLYMIQVISPSNPPGRGDVHWFEINAETEGSIEVASEAVIEVKALPGD
ncbi:hypothetical protein K9N68_37125 (plasmid) [Kovacikia minuta CCNUW1]|uniref:hypothetical protein n=1 Tax=Kovacikia minuta TaxID=2931930 RepID=UPI001CCE2F10|nr:hypothetical protein [Kovacikia minuta]UBF29835.1 hypothetical protein K9N68_37125 [Kovacikia minuta CCNUW1]